VEQEPWTSIPRGPATRSSTTWKQARHHHRVADLAFYAARDMARADWSPVLKAALERSPVCIHGARDMTDEAVIQHLASWPAESIYDGTRVAQPDEVWNYGRGDGVEKALCLAAILKARHRRRDDSTCTSHRTTPP
jgi:hypothetical protein